MKIFDKKLDKLADRNNGQYVVPTMPGRKTDDAVRNAILKAKQQNRTMKLK